MRLLFPNFIGEYFSVAEQLFNSCNQVFFVERLSNIAFAPILIALILASSSFLAVRIITYI